MLVAVANISFPSQLPWRLPVFTRVIAPWVTVVSGLIEMLLTPSSVGLEPVIILGLPLEGPFKLLTSGEISSPWADF